MVSEYKEKKSYNWNKSFFILKINSNIYIVHLYVPFITYSDTHWLKWNRVMYKYRTRNVNIIGSLWTFKDISGVVRDFECERGKTRPIFYVPNFDVILSQGIC